MTLLEAKEHKTYKIKSVNCDDDTNKYLSSLGFIKFEPIIVKYNDGSTTVIEIKDAEYCIGCDLVKQIEVEDSI